MRILITRPIEDGKEIAARLVERGHQAVLAPLLTPRFHEGPEPDLKGVQALLATSANGIRALARLAGIVASPAAPPTEWTVELAPASVTAERLEVLRAAGVTRLSLGIQSFQPVWLEALGRQHTVEQVRRAYDRIRAGGHADRRSEEEVHRPDVGEAQLRGLWRHRAGGRQ